VSGKFYKLSCSLFSAATVVFNMFFTILISPTRALTFALYYSDNTVHTVHKFFKGVKLQLGADQNVFRFRAPSRTTFYSSRSLRAPYSILGRGVRISGSFSTISGNMKNFSFCEKIYAGFCPTRFIDPMTESLLK